jgi:hypothetical protein
MVSPGCRAGGVKSLPAADSSAVLCARERDTQPLWGIGCFPPSPPSLLYFLHCRVVS